MSSDNNRISRVAGVGNESLSALSAVTKLFRTKNPLDGGNFLEIVTRLIADVTPKNIENFDLDDLERNMLISQESAEEKLRADPSIPLKESEIAALALYSSHSDFYRVLNAALRSENRSAVEPFVDIIWLIMLGLSKCPIYTRSRTVFRGVRLNLSQKYKKDAKITWHQFSSCSMSMETLAEEMFAGAIGDRTVFVIELTSTRARDISRYSLYPSEQEVILPPNTRFVVKSTVDLGGGLIQFHLEEAVAFDPILKYGEALNTLQTIGGLVINPSAPSAGTPGTAAGASAAAAQVQSPTAVPAPNAGLVSPPHHSEVDSPGGGGADAEKEAEQRAINELRQFFLSNDIVPARVGRYAKLLYDNGIATRQRLQWKLGQHFQFLETLGFDGDDCVYIRSVLSISSSVAAVPVPPATIPAAAPVVMPPAAPAAPAASAVPQVQSKVQTAQINVGDRVTVSACYETVDDAAGGPLRPGDIGTLIQNDQSDKPYKVRADSGYSKDREWWYSTNAIRLATSEEVRVAVAKVTAIRVFKVGNYVRIKALPQAEAEAAQNLHGGLAGDMISMLGKTGVVVNVDSDGDCEISVEGFSASKLWNPAILEFISEHPPESAAPTPSAPAPAAASGRLKVGDHCTVTENYTSFGDAGDGPLKPGLFGEVVTDDSSSKPFKVKGPGGKMWWYEAGALKRATPFKVGDSVVIRSVSKEEAEQAQKGHGGWVASMGDLLGKTGEITRIDSDGDCEVRVHGGQATKLWNPWLLQAGEATTDGRPTVGCKVMLSPTYTSEGDAAGGPLKPGDVGELVKDDSSGKPFQVKASDGRTWWYNAGAIVRAPSGSTSSRPASGSFAVGNRVRVRPVTVHEAEEAMKGHGGWGVDMGVMLGRVGTIQEIDSDGDCKVLVDRATKPKLWNPSLLEFISTSVTQPGSRLVVGDKVTVVPGYNFIEDAASGPLKDGDVGVLIKDDHSSKPFQVQADSKSWWYAERALCRLSDQATPFVVGSHVRILSMTVEEAEAAMKGHGGYVPDMGIMLGMTGVITRIDSDGDCEVKMDGGGGSKIWNPLMLTPTSSGSQGSVTGTAVQTGRLKVGEKVTVVSNYGTFGDASSGPLRPGDIGELVKDDGSSKPFQVKASDGRTWWYVEGALQRPTTGTTVIGTVVARALAVGNHVRIRAVSVADAEAAMKGHGGFVADMGIMLGRTGVVTRIDSDGDCEVLVDGGAAPKLWNPLLLEFLAERAPNAVHTGRLTVGENVTVAEGFESVGDAGKGPLKRGEVGQLIKDDGSEVPFQVQVGTKTWWYREAALKRVAAGSMSVFRVGQSVRIRTVPVAEAEAAQKGHGGWVSTMVECMGKTGEITRIDSDGDCEVTVAGASKLWNPLLLECSSVPMPVAASVRIKVGESVTVTDAYESVGDAANGPLKRGDVGELMKDDGSSVPYQVKVGDRTWWYREGAIRRVAAAPKPTFAVGNVVKIRNVSAADAEREQTGHGGWANEMQSMLGQSGTITAIDSDGDCSVLISGSTKLWNPSLLEFISAGGGDGGRFRVGESVTVTDNYESVGDARNGPLSRGQTGTVVKDDGSDVPYQVQVGERTWWYREGALKRPGAGGARLVVGDKVTVVANYTQHSDAGDGPLSPGDEGVIIQDDASDKPYQVRSTNGQKTWWYIADALRKL